MDSLNKRGLIESGPLVPMRKVWPLTNLYDDLFSGVSALKKTQDHLERMDKELTMRPTGRRGEEGHKAIMRLKKRVTQLAEDLYSLKHDFE